MNFVHTSRTVALALLVGSGGCGTGSVGPLPPAEPEADADITSASTALHAPLQGLAHDGQARRARDRFAGAPAEDKTALLAVLATL